VYAASGDFDADFWEGNDRDSRRRSHKQGQWIAQPNVESSSVGGVKGNYQMDDVLDKSAIDEFTTDEPQRSMVDRVNGDLQMGPAQQNNDESINDGFSKDEALI
jgi:hypothetical protein